MILQLLSATPRPRKCTFNQLTAAQRHVLELLKLTLNHVMFKLTLNHLHPHLLHLGSDTRLYLIPPDNQLTCLPSPRPIPPNQGLR